MSSTDQSNIWFHLYDYGTGKPYKGTTATSVSIPPSAVIDQFRDAVKVKYSDSHLKGISPSDLLVFKNKHSFDKRNSNEEKEVLLEEDSPVDGLGKSKKDALIVSSAELNSQRVYSKTIYIRQVDEDGDFTDKYKEYIVKNDQNLKVIYKYGTGLIQLSAPEKVIVNFDEIEDGMKYQVHKYSQDFPGWQKKEADAMEKETQLRMMTLLIKELQFLKAEELPISLSTEFLDEKGVKIQEWDGIISTKDTLYLLEAKHTMTIEKVYKIAERVKEFPEIVARSTRKDIDLENKKIVGVACGTLFSNDCRVKAHSLGLLDMYPSGSRYKLGGETIFAHSLT